jgi:inosine-uridine nucleoside N-ribohydrolase
MGRESEGLRRAGSMKRILISIALSTFILAPTFTTAQQKIKIIADQDSAGPEGTNFLSLLMLLRAPQVELLGITTVSGDQWMEPATVFALWATEITGRTDVPVIKGAEQPLVNSLREQEAREKLYGSYLGWHGSFNPDAPNPKETWAPPGGFPKAKPKPGRAADFIIDTIRAHPGEIVLYCAGPLTNIALAVSMDHDIVPLTKAIYIMGGSSAGGPELNWWWDPEAAAIVLRQPWKQIVITPFEAGGQVWSSERLMKDVVSGGGPLAAHVKQVYLDRKPMAGTSMWSMMWDELTVASILDPSVIKKSETMVLDVDITHGPKYGHTVVWKPLEDVPEFFLAYSGPRPVDKEKWRGHLTPPAQLHPASVQMDVDVVKFERIFVELMSH